MSKKLENRNYGYTIQVLTRALSIYMEHFAIKFNVNKDTKIVTSVSVYYKPLNIRDDIAFELYRTLRQLTFETDGFSQVIANTGDDDLLLQIIFTNETDC
jgi:hypothetical protein